MEAPVPGMIPMMTPMTVSYTHLVKLGGNKKKARYLLGVPGHYYSSEKYMATMFGFPNFVL